MRTGSGSSNLARRRASSRRRAPRAVAVALAFAAAALSTPAAARAALPFQGFYAGPIVAGSVCDETGTGATPDLRAGTHTDFCIAYSTKQTPDEPIEGDDLSAVTVDTPAGYAGLAAAIPTCPADGATGFNAGTTDDVGCAAETQVGSAFVAARTQITPLNGGNPILADARGDGRVYHLPRQAGEVARLGIVLDPQVTSLPEPKVKVIASIRLRPAPDVGLRAVIENLPRTAVVHPPRRPSQRETQPLAVDKFALTLWGSKADHPSMPDDFGYNGTDCSNDENTAIRAVSYDGTPTAADAAPYRLTGCDDPAITFDPSISVRTDENRPDVTTATDVSVGFAPSTTPGRVAATVKRAVVRLPEGLSLSAQIAGGAGGLRLCSAEAFALTTSAPAACPGGSVVGTATFTSPAVDAPLTGSVHLGPQPTPGALPDLYIEAALGTGADAPRVKLTGTLSVDGAGRVTAVLDGLPQLPVSQVALRFRGGSNAVFATPETCSASRAELAATSHATQDAPAARSGAYAVEGDCGAVGGFAPAIAFDLDNPNSAGRSTPLTVTIARPDRSARIGRTTVDLPPGMLASIRGVPECGQAAADAGSCPDETRVGSITAAAGVGDAPFDVPGDVFLVARRGVAVASLVFRVPVRLGELDLGLLNVPADVYLRANDQGLRIEAAVPTRFKGLPLDVRALTIRLDRPGFALSPTSCAPLSSTSTILSAGGVASQVSAGLQVAGCERLAFDPTPKVAVFGRTNAGSRPATQIRIDSAPGSSALRAATVALPLGLGFDTRQASRACSQADFARSACPASARIGGVGGVVSIVNERLTGRLFLLQAEPGQILPGIGIAFEGRFSANLAGRTSIDPKTNGLVTTFPTLPDVPLTQFEVGVDGGATGVLVASDSLCTQPLVVGATLVGSSGQKVTTDARSYCGLKLDSPLPRASATVRNMRSGKPTLALSFGAPDATTSQKAKRLRSVDIDVPSSWEVSGSRAAKGVSIRSVGAKGRTTVKKPSKDRLRITLPTSGERSFRAYTRTGTLAIRSGSARRTRRTVTVILTYRYTDGSHLRVPERFDPR